MRSFASMHNDYLDPDRYFEPDEEEQEEKPKMNTAAQSLGRLGRGKKKTLSKEAIKQRRKAARISGKKRKGRKLGPRKKSAPQEIVVESSVPVDPIETPTQPAPAQNSEAPAGDESIPTPTETLTQEPCQPPENSENKEKDNSCNESDSVLDSFNERKHLLA